MTDVRKLQTPAKACEAYNSPKRPFHSIGSKPRLAILALPDLGGTKGDRQAMEHIVAELKKKRKRKKRDVVISFTNTSLS
jgi:hypothetical protein